MVGGDGIAQDRQRLCLDDVHHRRGRHAHPFKIWRIGDIGRPCAPCIGVRTFDLDLLPMRIAFIDRGIARGEHRTVDVCGHDIMHLLVGGPDVAQIHVRTVGRLPNRRRGEVFGHGALERISDHQRRRGQEVCAHIGRHAAFKVAVARNDRGSDNVMAVNRRRNRLGQWSRIADAGGAAIADQVKADRIQIRRQARTIEIIGYNL